MTTNPDRLAGAELLTEAHDLITRARQDAYSHPTDDYGKVVEIFRALSGVTLTVEHALLFMVAVKFARLRTNFDAGRLHRDSLVDAAGYLGCLSMHLERTAARGTIAHERQPVTAESPPVRECKPCGGDRNKCGQWDCA